MKFEKSWALKGKQSYLALAKIIGSMDKPMDIAAFTNLGLNLVSVSSYVWGFTVPYPFLAVGATNLVYNIPYVRNRLDQTIYGNYLWGPQPSYNISEFQENKVSRPYLVCNYYRKKSSMIAGKKPEFWDWARSRISFQRTRISHQKTFLYKGYVVFMVGGYKSFKKACYHSKTVPLCVLQVLKTLKAYKKLVAGDAKKRQATKIND